MEPTARVEQPITTADLRHTLDQAAKLIRDWQNRLPADDTNPEIAVAHDLARIAGIAEATIASAACDTRTLYRQVTGAPATGPCLRVASTN